jgi:hypothetical protein
MKLVITWTKLNVRLCTKRRGFISPGQNPLLNLCLEGLICHFPCSLQGCNQFHKYNRKHVDSFIAFQLTCCSLSHEQAARGNALTANVSAYNLKCVCRKGILQSLTLTANIKIILNKTHFASQNTDIRSTSAVYLHS